MFLMEPGIVALAVLICIAVLSLIVFIIAFNRGLCFHDYTVGGGGMGDAWHCEKCELDSYPEGIGFKLVYRILGRTKEL